MAQDLRKMFAESYKDKKQNPPQGHEARFKALLDEKLPQEEKSSNWTAWLKIAAIVTVILTIGALGFKGFYGIQTGNTQVVNAAPKPSVKKEAPVFLSDISPEFKKIENFYLAGIHTELAKLEITGENKALIDSFMEQLANLDADYQELNQEINHNGVTEEAVNALINNLKLRLDLLMQLKEKLKSLKQNKLEETQAVNI